MTTLGPKLWNYQIHSPQSPKSSIQQNHQNHPFQIFSSTFSINTAFITEFAQFNKPMSSFYWFCQTEKVWSEWKCKTVNTEIAKTYNYLILSKQPSNICWTNIAVGQKSQSENGQQVKIFKPFSQFQAQYLWEAPKTSRYKPIRSLLGQIQVTIPCVISDVGITNLWTGNSMDSSKSQCWSSQWNTLTPATP